MNHGRGEDSQGSLSRLEPPWEIETRPTNRDALWDLLERAKPPVMFWSAPQGSTFIGAGAVAGTQPFAQEGHSDQLHQSRAIFNKLDYNGPEMARPRLFGGMSFDQETPRGEHWAAFPGNYFFLPDSQIVIEDEEVWHTSIGDRPDTPPRSAPEYQQLPTKVATAHEPARSNWYEQVDRACEEINSGSYSKVVLAQGLDLTLSDPVTLPTLLQTLQEENPRCYITAFKPTESAVFVAATPERLVRRDESIVRTDALAGSSGRGETNSTDKRLSSALEASPKNQHEHALVVDAITHELECFGGNITVGNQRVFRLETVQHLHTPIEVEYDRAPHVLELVEALHPTPAVGGMPRNEAINAIKRIESIERGWYAAPIGWLDAQGNGSFVIGIRSGVFQENTARLFAGAGIVADSDSAEEWDELQLKYEPLLSCFTRK